MAFDRDGAGHRRGIAALTMAVMLAMLALAVAGLVMGGAREHDLAVSRMDTERSFYCAEAGISMGLREAYLGSDVDGDGGIGSISDDNNASNDPRIGTAGVHVARLKAPNSSTLIAKATAGTTQHRVETVISPDTDGTAPGLMAEYFVSSNTVNWLAEIDWTGAPVNNVIASQINFAMSSGQSWPGGPTNNWGRRYTGRVTVAQAGTWTFYTDSDDGSEVWIDGTRVVSNDGAHAMQVRSGSIALAAGQHDIEVLWFERTGSFGLVLYWSGPGVATQTLIPASALTH